MLCVYLHSPHVHGGMRVHGVHGTTARKAQDRKPRPPADTVCRSSYKHPNFSRMID